MKQAIHKLRQKAESAKSTVNPFKKAELAEEIADDMGVLLDEMADAILQVQQDIQFLRGQQL